MFLLNVFQLTFFVVVNKVFEKIRKQKKFKMLRIANEIK